jgi:phosphatidylcholine synthase
MPSSIQRNAALAVHIFTASGAAVGLFALVAAFDRNFALSFAWLGLALLIDAVDGTFARWLNVRDNAPFIDGIILDLVVDFLTYVVVPVVALWRSDLLEPTQSLVAGAIILATSALYFADTRMKTHDLWFRGFPACWNVVVLYLFVFRFSSPVTLALCAVFVCLMFVPIVSVHPMRVTRLRGVTIAVMLIWFASAAWAIRSDLAGSMPAKIGLAMAGIYFALLPLTRSTNWGRQSGKAG